MIKPDLPPALDLNLVDDIFRAQEVFGEPTSPVLRTELMYDDILSERYEANIWFASELHQLIGAYKIRGAYNFVQSLSEEQRRLGIVAATAGNHGKGIALAANLLGVNCHIFMPECTPQHKVEGVAACGGDTTEITIVGKTFDDCESFAYQYSNDTGAVFAHPFNDRKVIAGQGTLGLEVFEELPSLDMLFCPVGGSGLLAGVATALGYQNPRTKIIGVEPLGAASMQAALLNRDPVPLPQEIDTFVDGAAVQQVGEIPFAIAKPLLSRLITVDNSELCRTTTDLWERKHSLPVELAGALAVAGLEADPVYLRGKTALCILSGGNLSRERYDNQVRSFAQV